MVSVKKPGVAGQANIRGSIGAETQNPLDSIINNQGPSDANNAGNYKVSNFSGELIAYMSFYRSEITKIWTKRCRMSLKVTMMFICQPILTLKEV